MDLRVVYFGQIGMLDVFQLVGLCELFVEFGEVIYIVLLMIHEVFVRRLLESVDVCFSEKWILKLLEKLYFVEEVGVNRGHSFSHPVYNL